MILGRMETLLNDVELPPALLIVIKIKGGIFLVKKNECERFWTLPGGVVEKCYPSLADFIHSAIYPYFDGLSVRSIQHLTSSHERIEIGETFLPCSLFHCSIKGDLRESMKRLTWYAPYSPPFQVLAPEARLFMDRPEIQQIFMPQKAHGHP